MKILQHVKRILKDTNICGRRGSILTRFTGLINKIIKYDYFFTICYYI